MSTEGTPEEHARARSIGSAWQAGYRQAQADAEAAGAPLRAALERIAYGDEFSTLNANEDRSGMRQAAIAALTAERQATR